MADANDYQGLWLERDALLRFKNYGPGTLGPTAQLRLAVLEDKIARIAALRREKEKSAESERELYEAWYDQHGNGFTFELGWRVWQAARATPAADAVDANNPLSLDEAERQWMLRNALQAKEDRQMLDWADAHDGKAYLALRDRPGSVRKAFRAAMQEKP